MRTRKSRPHTGSCCVPRPYAYLVCETDLRLQWIPRVRGMETRAQGPPNVENIIGEPHIKVEPKGLHQRQPPFPPSASESHRKTYFAQNRAGEGEKGNPALRSCNHRNTEAQIHSPTFVYCQTSTSEWYQAGKMPKSPKETKANLLQRKVTSSYQAFGKSHIHLLKWYEQHRVKGNHTQSSKAP